MSLNPHKVDVLIGTFSCLQVKQVDATFSNTTAIKKVVWVIHGMTMLLLSALNMFSKMMVGVVGKHLHLKMAFHLIFKYISA